MWCYLENFYFIILRDKYIQIRSNFFTDNHNFKKNICRNLKWSEQSRDYNLKLDLHGQTKNREKTKF